MSQLHASGTCDMKCPWFLPFEWIAGTFSEPWLLNAMYSAAKYETNINPRITSSSCRRILTPNIHDAIAYPLEAAAMPSV